MRKIFLRTTAVAVLGAIALSACSNNKPVTDETGKESVKESTKESEAKKSDDKNALNVMIPEWAVPSDALLKEFTDSTGIAVNINRVDWDAIRDKISIAASGGEASADVVEVDWSWVGEFGEADWLEPLEVDDALKADMPTISTFSVGDKVLAIPYSNDYRIAYYNTMHFEKAGIGEEPTTYNEVYEAVKAIKEAGVAEHPYPLVLTAEEKASTGLIWTAYTMNDVVFNADGTLNEASVKEALNFYDKLIKEDLIDPADKTADGGKTYERLTNGTASFLTGPTSYIANVENPEKSKVVGEVVSVLMPGKTGNAKHTMALPEALGITKFSKNKENARKFIDWYTSAEVQEKLNEELGNLPTRNSVLEKLVNDGKIENAGAMLDQAKLIASPFPGGVPVYYNEMSNAIYNAVNGMALGNLSVDEAFTQMDTKIKELIEENK
jgi:hypothetical protein